MCLNPNYVKRYIDSSTGESKIRFIEFPEYLQHKDNEYYFTIPCGKCAECLELYSMEWAYRCLAEAQTCGIDKCCFLTLTYKDNPYSLNKDDLQKFIKRLRRKLEPKKIRYFACGEYGSKGLRPHYHLILFDYVPDDLIFLKMDKRHNRLYISPTIDNLWSLGFHSVGTLTQFSAKYCAKYMQKLNTLPDDAEQPFTTMSLKPGLGYQYFLEHKENILISDSIVFEGKKFHVPRYFLRKCNSDEIQELKNNRKLKASLLYDAINLRNTKFERIENEARKYK